MRFVALFIALCVSAGAWAQGGWPAKPIRIVVPVTTGGPPWNANHVWNGRPGKPAAAGDLPAGANDRPAEDDRSALQGQLRGASRSDLEPHQLHDRSPGSLRGAHQGGNSARPGRDDARAQRVLSERAHRDRGRHPGLRLRELGRRVRAGAHAARDRPQAERRARRRARERRCPQALRRHGPRRQALIARAVRQLRAIGVGALESGACRQEVLSYMLRRYWPPTSNKAWVICPSEQTRTPALSTPKTSSLRITAWRSRSSMAGERSEFF